MDRFAKIVLLIGFQAILTIGPVVNYPADHREDTVLPFSLSPGNVNLETYYLDKYPQPGVPGGPLPKKPTSQMTASPLDPAPVPEANENMFLVQKTKDPHAMFRTRRSVASRLDGYHGGSGYRLGSIRYGPYTDDNLHLHQYPRHDGNFYEQQQQQYYHQRDHNSHGSHHTHQHHHHSPEYHQHDGRY